MEVHHLLEEGTDLKTQLLCSRMRVHSEQDRKVDKTRLSDRHLNLDSTNNNMPGRQAGKVVPVVSEKGIRETDPEAPLVD